MYKTTKKIDKDADWKVLLQTKDAIRCLRRESIGRTCYIVVSEVPLPVLGEDGEFTKFFPAYQHVKVPRPVAEYFIKDSLSNFEQRGAHIQLHIYGSCIFIGGHYHKPEPTDPS